MINKHTYCDWKHHTRVIGDPPLYDTAWGGGSSFLPLGNHCNVLITYSVMDYYVHNCHCDSGAVLL